MALSLESLRRIVLLRTRLTRAALWSIDSIACAAYWVADRVTARKEVRSVLHLAIVSHKPFMLSRAMRALGLKSSYLAMNVPASGSILNVGWDYRIPASISPWRRRVLESYYLWTVLARHDVIHSHFRTFLSNTGWELRYLRRLRKVLVFHARGCDYRFRSKNMRLHPELNLCQECDYPAGSCDTEYQHGQVALAERYGDVFFATTPDLTDFLRGAEHVPFIQPIGIDVAAIQPAPRTPNVFRVVTSSNHHGLDGTRFIRAAVAALQSEGRPIELVEVSHTAYAEALAIYKSADVYAGKLRMGYYNNANIETMMLGVPNMSYLADQYRQLVPDCPIIVATPRTIEDRLRYYMDHREELRAIGARGPEFVRRHHDPMTIVQQMVDRYNQAFRVVRSGRAAAQPVHQGAGRSA